MINENVRYTRKNTTVATLIQAAIGITTKAIAELSIQSSQSEIIRIWKGSAIKIYFPKDYCPKS
jgi:hypothetical protein